jgi:hypothetical protein
MTLVNIIGPRCSGKSTYVAALAGWNKQKEIDLKINIQAINDKAQQLSEAWKYIVLQGLSLNPTDFSAKRNDGYFFEIDIYRKKILKSKETFSFSLIDNPGEIFEGIERATITGNDLFFSQFYQNIINNLRKQSNLLIMIDYERLDLDREYAGKIDIFLKDIFNKGFDNKCFKVALVFSKCDRSYVWLNRHIEGQTIKDYSRVTSVIEKWSSVKKFSCKSFLISTFGGLSGDSSVRNSIKEHNHLYVLRDPSQWKPYGLIAPLYWLSTGKDLKGIDCY